MAFDIYMSKKKTKTSKLSQKDREMLQDKDIQHYTAILLEEIRSDFKMVIEKTEGTEDRLRHEFDTKLRSLEEQMNLRFNVLKFKIGQIEES